MAKHTQTIRLSVFGYFLGLALKGLILLEYLILEFRYNILLKN